MTTVEETMEKTPEDVSRYFLENEIGQKLTARIDRWNFTKLKRS